MKVQTDVNGYDMLLSKMKSDNDTALKDVNNRSKTANVCAAHDSHVRLTERVLRGQETLGEVILKKHKENGNGHYSHQVFEIKPLGVKISGVSAAALLRLVGALALIYLILYFI